MSHEDVNCDAVAAVSNAIVAEFNALRAEITDLERHEKLSLQLALTSIRECVPSKGPNDQWVRVPPGQAARGAR